MAVPDRLQTEALAKEALDRGRRRLLDLQHADGFWKGALDTNVTMDAEDLLLREFLGIRGREETRQAAAWIRSQQLADGGFATFAGGPPELSTTVEAYVALRLAGDPPDAAHMMRAAALARELGGVERSRIFTRIWLALFGWWDWAALPTLPPEIVLLPSWFPLNVYDFACWARQTIVPLAIVSAHRPSRSPGFAIDELRSGAEPPPRPPAFGWPGLLDRAMAGLGRYERRPIRALRRLALRHCAEWIVRRQEADGSWGGIQPPWVYSILGLHLLGYPLDHPVLRRALEGLESFAIVEDGTRRLEACQSPVWDTALAVVALADAGLAPDHPGLLRAAEWLLGEEVRVRGDWSVRRSGLEPAGWAFEFANANHPDLDDTAEVVLALRRVRHPEPERVEAAIERAVAWTLGMQSAGGGWAAFDADNTRALCRQLPFCDFGEVIDPPSADVTAHVLEMLAGEGLAEHAAVEEGRRWLLAEQEGDGAWFGRWGANLSYGTGAALPALRALGMEACHPALERASHWLEAHQNPDGGWGEDLRGYRESARRGRGESTASQTSWALLGLLAAGVAPEAVHRGVRWLVSHQDESGGWDATPFTGTGFPGDFYINYELYHRVFPVMALGRFLVAGA